MTVTTYAKQRMAVMPSAALAGPVVLDRMGGDLAGSADCHPLGVRNHRHPWLCGQPFHPAPREVFDLERRDSA